MQFAKYHCAEDVAGDESLKKEFNDWMRVIRNLAYNTTYNDIEEFIDALKSLIVLSENVYNNNPKGTIRTYLKDNGKIDSFYGEQIKEETEKARQIIDEGGTWETRIEEAEDFVFFEGSIRFLYRTDDDNEVGWNSFENRYSNSQKYFDENGVKDDDKKYRTDAMLLKAFVSRVPGYLWWNKDVFDNKSNTWKKLLTNSDLRKITNTILSGDISVADIGTVNWHKKLYKTDLLSYVATNMEGSRVRDIHGHKAIYPPRYPGVILDMDMRDNILSKLMNDNIIEIDHWQIVAGMPLFRGWDINFKWNKCDDYKFQWNTDRNIYLLNNKNERMMKDNQYLSFLESEMSKEDYIEKFEELIGII
jgi:hypothetical protein